MAQPAQAWWANDPVADSAASLAPPAQPTQGQAWWSGDPVAGSPAAQKARTQPKTASDLEVIGSNLLQGVTDIPDALQMAFNPAAALQQSMTADVVARDPKVIAAAKAQGMTPDAFVRRYGEFRVSGFGPQLNKGIEAVTGGYNPQDVPVTGPRQRIIAAASRALPSAFVPAGEGAGLGRLLDNALISVTAGGGSQAAQEVLPEDTPEPVKQLVGLGAGVVSGLATHKAIGGVRSAAEAAAGATGRVAEPFQAAASENAAQGQAANILQARATDPAAVKATLEAEPAAAPLVPGSEPTTFQATGDMGLGSLEREVATRAPEKFNARAGEQNAARMESLAQVQAGADPVAVAQTLADKFAGLDAETEQNHAQLTAQAQAKAEALGGEGAPEAYGEHLRGALQEAEDTARTRERGLWQAVDPNGDLTGNTVQTSAKAKEITEALPSTAKPMAGEEAAIFDAAKELPSLAPVSDLIALRSRVSTEMRNELIQNGRSPAYARLAGLRGAIQDNLATSISQEVVNDAKAVSHGTLAPEEATGDRIQSWLDTHEQAEGVGRTVARGGPGEAGAATPSGVATPGAATGETGAHGAALPETGGPAGAGGAESVPAEHPTFDPAAAERLAAATEATKERARLFGLGSTSSVLRKAGASDLYRLPEGRVPEKFFHSGPTGYSDMQALYSAVGHEKAVPIVADYAASSLRKAAGRPDGTLDPAKFAAWRSRHADALRALPEEVRDKFSGAVKAAKAMDDAAKARVQTLKAAQTGAIGKIMGLTDPASVRETVGSILGGKNATGEMRMLAKAVEHDPRAIEGLRQSVVDYISNRFVSNRESATTGVNEIAANAFQTFFKRSKSALKQVFTPAQVNRINAIVEDIQRAKRSQTAVKLPGQSNTAQDLYGIMVRRAEGLAKPGRTKTVLDVMGGILGATHGVEGAAIGTGFAHLAGGLGVDFVRATRAAGISRVDQLVTEAMLHPELAKELLKRAPRVANSPEASKLASVVRRSVIGSAFALNANAH